MRGGTRVLSRILASGALLAAASAPAQTSVQPDIASADVGREFSTDRPDKTESPYSVDAGRFQVEIDLFGYTREREGGERATLVNAGTFNLKYGVARNADLQLIAAPYLRLDRNGRRTEGVGDVTVRLKRNLWGNDGGPTALALMPYVTLPTATDGLGADRAEFGVIVPFAWAFSERVGLGAMTELDVVGRERGEYQASFINSATLSAAVTEKLGAYVELFTERATERGSRWVVTGDMGLTYALTEDVQLDAGANIGLTRAADDLNVFLGLSRRF